MMEGSHDAYSSLMGSANHPSTDDVANTDLDFGTLFSSEHALTLGPYEQCIHDDSCLHFTQSHRAQSKAQRNFAQTPPATSSSALSRGRIRSNRTEHGRTQSQVDIPSGLDHPQYGWDHIFSDNSLAGSNLYSGGMPGICKDDDCVSMSCSSACEGSCPSQCGETSHAVCCDDDACGSPQLCIDEDCQVASEPCTDENCVVDPSINPQQPRTGPAITCRDKAAAVALTSIGDNNPQMLQNAFFQQPQQEAQSGDALMNFLGLPHSLPCGSLSMDSILATHNGQPTVPNQPYQMAFEYALANHIMQYHDPSHGLASNESCVANEPSQLITKCTLPIFNPNDLANTDPFLPQLQSHECGFEVQDPTEYAQHIFQEHRSTLMMQGSQYGFPGSGHAHSHSAGSNSHQNQGVYGPYFNYNTTPNSNHGSPSMPSLTNMSIRPSLSATPVSLPTPSPLESEHSFTEATSTAHTRSPVSETRPQVMAQEDQFLCRWLGGRGDSICGQRFENDEQLQKHCKQDHLKQLKKVNGGFRCGWANCTRDTCFTQRSKVERHMQVHTGYKPVHCDICGAALSAKQALEQHMRIHTGETPWVCKYPGCGCAFKQQSALTMHERTHTGDKPLECEICGKRFSESSNLSKHRRTHNVKGMHECQLCGKDFHRLDQLRRHMGTNHKDRPAEVDAILSEAKSKLRANKVSKLKKIKSKGKDGQIKSELLLDFDDVDTMDMIEEPIHTVILHS